MSLKSVLNCLIEIRAICEKIIASFITRTAFEEGTIICCCLMTLKESPWVQIEMVADDSVRQLIVWIEILAGYFPTLWPGILTSPLLNYLLEIFFLEQEEPSINIKRYTEHAPSSLLLLHCSFLSSSSWSFLEDLLSASSSSSWDRDSFYLP